MTSHTQRFSNISLKLTLSHNITILVDKSTIVQPEYACVSLAKCSTQYIAGPTSKFIWLMLQQKGVACNWHASEPKRAHIGVGYFSGIVSKCHHLGLCEGFGGFVLEHLHFEKIPHQSCLTQLPRWMYCLVEGRLLSLGSIIPSYFETCTHQLFLTALHIRWRGGMFIN